MREAAQTMHHFTKRYITGPKVQITFYHSVSHP